jgi:hypothetical protein
MLQHGRASGSAAVGALPLQSSIEQTGVLPVKESAGLDSGLARWLGGNCPSRPCAGARSRWTCIRPALANGHARALTFTTLARHQLLCVLAAATFCALQSSVPLEADMPCHIIIMCPAFASSASLAPASVVGTPASSAPRLVQHRCGRQRPS